MWLVLYFNFSDMPKIRQFLLNFSLVNRSILWIFLLLFDAQAAKEFETELKKEEPGETGNSAPSAIDKLESLSENKVESSSDKKGNAWCLKPSPLLSLSIYICSLCFCLRDVIPCLDFFCSIYQIWILIFLSLNFPFL